MIKKKEKGEIRRGIKNLICPIFIQFTLPKLKIISNVHSQYNVFAK